MRIISPILILILLFTACEQPKKKNSTVQQNPTNQKNPNSSYQTPPQYKIASFEKKVENNLYRLKNLSNSINEFYEQNTKVHILNDSLKKINKGKGVDIYNRMKSFNPSDSIRACLQDLIQNDTVNVYFKKTVTPILLSQSIWRQDLDLFVHLDSIFKYSYENSYFSSSVDIVRDIIDKKRKIENLEIDEDEKLYLVGKLLIENYKTCFNSGEVCHNMSWAFSYFNQLLENYPLSQYADNSELEILKYRELYSHEGGSNDYNLKAIEEYQGILDKYENTDEAAWINYRIAELFEMSIGYFGSERTYEFARSGLTKITKVINEHPDFNPDGAKRIKSVLDKLVKENCLVLTLSIDQQTYYSDDPIFVTYTLVNKCDSLEKTITLRDNCPSIGLKLKTRRHLTFKPSEAKCESRQTVLFPGDSIQEKWDISTEVYDEQQNSFGNYVFVKPGYYAFANEKYNSNSILIEFKKRQNSL